jgi:predicted lipoprotein with Yx(FWY)xxD motif
MRLAIPLAILVATTAVAAAAAYGHRSVPDRAVAAHAQIRLRSTSLGSVLVDARGRTLYLFTADKAGKSACTGQCAAAWPPFVATGRPLAGVGVKQALLRTVKRSDGRLQVVYAGHPLYFFSGDRGAGATNGEGLEGAWFALDAHGAKVAAPAATTGGSGGNVAPPPPTTTDPGYDDGY